MTVIEMGSLAGAMIAVMTLISKIISLIASIQNLITRLDTMQRDIEFSQSNIILIKDQTGQHENRLSLLEEKMSQVQVFLKEKVKDAFKE